MKDNILSVVIAPAAAGDGDVATLCAEHAAEVAARYPDADEVPSPLHPGVTFLVARAEEPGHGRRAEPAAVGCAALQPLEPGVGEVKRMYVRPAFRGYGISRRLLTAIEDLAGGSGYTAVKLETGDLQPESIGLYVSSGYTRIPPFGPYIGNARSLCFEKPLLTAARSLSGWRGHPLPLRAEGR